MKRAIYDQPEYEKNELSSEDRKNLAVIITFGFLAILALAAIVIGAILIIRNQKARKTLESLSSLNAQATTVSSFVVNTAGAKTATIEPIVVETAMTETTVFTPVPSAEVQLPSGTILATKVGFYDEKNGYQHYDSTGENYPRWASSGSGEIPKSIMVSQPAKINEGLAVHTFGDVGVMFSVFPLDFEGLETENNQLYVYGDSSLTLSTNQGVTNIALSKGAIFLKMAAPADITEVVFPNHGDATAKVIGGSVLLALDAETISFWCVSEECQLHFFTTKRFASAKSKCRSINALRTLWLKLRNTKPHPSDRKNMIYGTTNVICVCLLSLLVMALCQALFLPHSLHRIILSNRLMRLQKRRLILRQKQPLQPRPSLPRPQSIA